jgi:hypothetical protein
MVTSPGYAAGPVLHGLHPRGGNADAMIAERAADMILGRSALPAEPEEFFCRT